MVMVNDVEVREGFYYNKEHTWLKVEEGKVRIGISDHAQKQLKEIVVVDLLDEGDEVSQGDSFGEVESVKTVSDLISPISGTITDVNGELEDSPELVNDSPYDEGWMIVVEPSDLDAELENLMSFDDAVEFYEEVAKEE
ncbi:MAG: glycine cleavage system protein GcvH [Promethearchaeota archaeon]